MGSNPTGGTYSICTCAGVSVRHRHINRTPVYSLLGSGGPRVEQSSSIGSGGMVVAQVETSGGLAFERRGRGFAVVLLHGVGHDRTGWDPVVEYLEADHEVVAVDLPGHGDSPLGDSSGPLGVVELTDRVQQFLDDTGLECPTVVGNSLGGAIALELAARGRAGKVVALAPIGFWSRFEVGYAVAVLRASRALAALLAPVRSALLGWTPARAALLGIYCAHPGRMSSALALRTVAGFVAAEGLPAILPHSRRYRFERAGDLSRVPVTIAWGDRDRLLIGGQARRARAALPAARHVRLAGCGHVPMFDDPRLVAEVILGA
ncbi:alpha/beta fold hydrolase [Pseudonocardia sp. CA-107938]|uniref:alpha/beta fold hydrolase n=1 Tax=Pseudonocardia sp. CA-107938 TaxID=3240021 RepID=UPI003D8D4A1A